MPVNHLALVPTKPKSNIKQPRKNKRSYRSFFDIQHSARKRIGSLGSGHFPLDDPQEWTFLLINRI